MKKSLGDFTTDYKKAVDEARAALCVNNEGLYRLLRRKYPDDNRITLGKIRNAYIGRANNAAFWLKPLIQSLYKPFHMTDLEISVMRHIKGRDRSRRLNSKQLSRLASEDTGRRIVPSEIRATVFNLRHRAEMAICSSQEGYWEAQSKEEVLDIVRRLSNRIENQMKSIRGLTSYLENQTPQAKLL